MLYSDFIRTRMNSLNTIAEVEGYPCILSKSKGKNLKDYKVYGYTAQTKLLGDYTELEYIESTGTQYIDTGFIANQDTSVKIKYQMTDVYPTASGLFGDRNGATSNNYSCHYDTASSILRTSYNNGYYSTSLSYDNNIHLIYKNKNLTYYDGDLIATATYASFTNVRNLTLFKINNTFYNSNMKVFSFELYDNDVLIRNMIPAKRNSDNVIGMYDTVNNVFYTNKGTGTFIAGAEIAPTPDEPISVYSLGERTRNLYDNTGLIAGADRCIITTLENGFEVENTYGAGYVYAEKSVYLEAGTYTFSRKWRVTEGVISATSGLIRSNITGSAQILLDKAVKSASFEITTSGKYKFYFYQSGAGNTGAVGQKIEFYDIQIEEGSTATDYIPYNAVEVKGSGKNLTPMPNNYQGHIIFSPNITLEAGTYTLTVNATLIPSQITVKYKVNNTIIANKYGNNQLTFILNETAEINWFVYNVNYTSLSDVLNAQLEEGSTATSYEPYQEPQTAVVDLTGHEPLREIGDIKDYIDYKNNRIVRNIGKLVFDGTENFIDNVYGWKNAIVPVNINVKQYDEVQNFYICTHYTGAMIGANIFLVVGQMNISSGFNKWIIFNKGDFTNVTEFKAWLAEQYANGTPVELYYQLAEPTYEAITLPQVQTVKNTCTITAQDEYLDSSNIWAKYVK